MMLLLITSLCSGVRASHSTEYFGKSLILVLLEKMPRAFLNFDVLRSLHFCMNICNCRPQEILLAYFCFLLILEGAIYIC